MLRIKARHVISAVLATLLAAVICTGAAVASPVTGTDQNGTYLALGDSVGFGYVPAQAVPAPNYFDAHSFVGYPEFLAQQLRERVFNASCPGETTASMLSPDGVSNGCENSPFSSVGYRTLYPLHVEYQGTQMQYALQFLADHKNTRLVTIDIGANDVFLCQETTQDHCASSSELAGVASTIATNLVTTVGELRSTGYQGPIVILTYYSLSYSDPTTIAGTLFLDAAISSAAQTSGAIVADGFTAFEGPALNFGGDPCAAGLLIRLPDGTCNIHPSAAGQQVLADAIAGVLPS